MIRIGIRTPFEMVPELAGSGYDFFELSLKNIALLSEAEFSELLLYMKAMDLKTDVLCDMLPDDLPLTGAGVQAARQHAWLDPAFARASRMGGHVVLFDAAASRNVREGVDFPLARRQVGNFLRIAHGHAAATGLKVGVQNLRYGECNLINTVSEAALMAALLQQDCIGVAADIPNMRYCQEQSDALKRCGSSLMHVHLGGSFPKKKLPAPKDGEDYPKIFRILARMGYNGTVSAVSDIPFTAAQAISALETLQKAREESLLGGN